jgi:hypothetical protein
MINALDSPLNLLIVVPTTLGGEKTRIIQEIQVVDRDYRPPVTRRRRYEIGAMQEVDAQSSDLNAQRPALEAMMRWCPTRNGTKIRIYWRDVTALAAVENEIINTTPIQRSQSIEQVHDIAADPPAGVVDDTGINANSHTGLQSNYRYLSPLVNRHNNLAPAFRL